MKSANPIGWLVVPCVCLALSACSPLAPTPDRSKYFLLTPLPGRADAVALGSATSGSNAALVIGLGPIDFPSYLKRPEVVTRIAPNQIVLSDQERWGEPLDRNFARVLAEDLAELLKTQRIEHYPWPRQEKIDYQVSIHVERFETTAGGESQLVAHWTIRDGRDGGTLYSSETTATSRPGSDGAGASAALSGDVATLSRAISSRIIKLRQKRSPARS